MSFRLKLTLLACIVAIVPLIVVGWLVNDINRDELENTNRQLLDAVGASMLATFEATIAEGDRTLISSAGALDRPTEERDAIVEAALDTQQLIKHIAIYDADGTKVVEVDSTAKLQPPALPPKLTPNTRRGTATYGDVAFVKTESYVLRKVTTNDGRYTLAAYVSLAAVAHRSVEIGVNTLPTGQIAMATTDLRIIADSLGERVGTTATREDFGVLEGVDRAFENNRIGVIRDADRGDGTRVTGMVKRLTDEAPFVVMIERPYKEVYKSIVSIRRFLLGSVLAAILVAAAAGILLARRMTKPITALVDYAGELAERRFDRKVTVRSTDELGVLGNALENAATQLAASEIAIKKEHAIRSDLGRYLPNKLVDQIVARERSLALGGERREITVLFADVVGFTPLAEREAAETVVTLLNELFSILTEIVFRHGGTVDKFVGDCVMAVWGATEDQPDHPQRAIAAARDMQRWLEVANELWMAQHDVNIELAIGVHTGDAVVGNFGSETRMEFTAIGDVVNVAARLEAIARPNQILSTIMTRSRLADDKEFISLGVRPLIGKAQPIELFEVRA